MESPEDKLRLRRFDSKPKKMNEAV